ncbi:MAG: hypothetical protein OXU21_11090 [Chloroflexota bacterium]|nr:hypothetical protein [Chloroflexota bacterium]
MSQWAIIADDLTGALDTALQFRNAGRRTRVSTRDGTWPPDSQTMAMSTASRHLGASAAYDAVRGAVGAAAPGALIYKKTDSLLRGNIAAELQAALDGTDAATLVYTPAFPSGGRTTESGTLTLWGTPVSEADPGRDPVTPALESHIPTLIQSTSALTSRVIPTSVVRSGVPALADALREARDAGVNVILPDIAEDSDLQCVAAAMDAADLLRVSAGSAGLAAPLARLDETPPQPVPEMSRTTRTLAIIGSPMEHTQQQLAEAAATLGVKPIPLPQLPGASIMAAATVRAGWSLDRPALVDAVIPVKHPSPEAQAAQQALVTQFTGTIWRGTRPIGLVLSGGDTARAAFAAIPAEAIELAGEIGWGVPYGVFTSGRGEGWPVVTKAGVMGGPTALVDALRAIGTP